MRLVVPDIEEVGIARFNSGAVRAEHPIHAAADIDYAFFGQSRPFQDAVAGGFGNSKHALRPPGTRPDDEVVKELLCRCPGSCEIQMNQVMNCEDKGNRTRERRVEAGRKKEIGLTLTNGARKP